tara:strand:+ start:732 stop:1505 length:774 start_codon:yes stop_codon:yes gene_type:complete
MNINKSDVLGIIPARYGSSRLEGKPLAKIGNKPMIQHVYERCSLLIKDVLVATDDNRILETVESFGGNVVLTNTNHTTGTNRCLEAYDKWSQKTHNKYRFILNIQGDEPLIDSEHLTQLIDCFKDENTSLATLALETKPNDHIEEGKVYLTKDKNNFALYFSRFPIPFLRDVKKENWTKHQTYYQHIGIYGFTTNALKAFCQLKESNLEKNEKLEQLRWLEEGYKIKVGITSTPSHPVDTIEDLEKVRQLYASKNSI